MDAKIRYIFAGRTTIDGAGVRLKRIFANEHVKLFDPFLLLDNFGSDNPQDYLAGFPWHPHRGIETVTYMLSGEVRHGDSMGNKGVINAGDIQWMTAGSGIIHEEMPQLAKQKLDGLQLWVNLPRKSKMTAPRYRGITKEMVPLVKKDGAELRVISGSYDGITGPVTNLAVKVRYLDIKLTKPFSISLDPKMNTFLYMFQGSAKIAAKELPCYSVALLEGDNLTVSPNNVCRFILVSGTPLHEPVAWGGPIVMNTEDELEIAFEELNQGTFLKPDVKKDLTLKSGKVKLFYK